MLSPYLLSSIAECSVCHGSLVAISRGQGKAPRYGCLQYHQKGKVGCDNGLQIRQDCLEKPVLDALAKALSPEEIERGITVALATSKGTQNDAVARRAAILEELRAISDGEKRLLDALFVGGVTAESIKTRIEEAHARRAVLEGELARIAEPIDIQGGAEKLRAYAADLRGLVDKHVVQARQLLRAVLAGNRLICVPYEDETGHGYRFDGDGLLVFNTGKNGVEFPVASVVSAMVV